MLGKEIWKNDWATYQGDKRALTKEELKEFQQKERAYEKAFYQNIQIKKQMSGSARKQPPNPFNQVFFNVVYSLNQKIELSILAMRQRRRFK